MLDKRGLIVGGAALVLAIGASATWLLLSKSEVGADATNPELVALGRTVYMRQCASCHGTHLEGQPNWKERLPSGRLPAPPHDSTGHTWHHPDKQLFDMTKNGATGILPGYESDMPPFKGVLTDREILAVLAYIKSSWPPDTRARQERINKQSEHSDTSQ